VTTVEATATTTAATTTTLDTGDRLLAEARQFVYRVRSVACLATGSSFATRQGIVTNRHVASGSTSLELSTWAGTDFNATVRSISGGPDLTLLSSSFSQDAATLSTSAVLPGTEVWVAGYPEGNQLSVFAGIVMDYTSGAMFDEPGQVMEITNPVEPGNSGSPLLDSEGQVVGVVFAIETATGDGLAIPASTLAKFLKSPGTNTSGECTT
jgi:S1-C subfamily serine protease